MTKESTRAPSMLLSMLLALSCLPACGPEDVEHGDWMIGTFSPLPEDWVVQGSLTRYVVHDDGTFESIYVYRCGEHEEHLDGEYGWRHLGSDAIEVFDREGGDVEGFDAKRLRRTDDCNRPSMEDISGGRVLHDVPLHRGAMCMMDLGPCESGTNCDSCRTKWCDGSPPACDEP